MLGYNSLQFVYQNTAFLTCWISQEPNLTENNGNEICNENSDVDTKNMTLLEMKNYHGVNNLHQ